MTWSGQAVRDAAHAGNYGRVIKLTRVDAHISQKQLAEACGVSQSAISRLEGRGTAAYNMTLLARAALHLHLPPRLVGLADLTAAQAARADGTEVERRNFLAGAAAVVTAPSLPSSPKVGRQDGSYAATLRLVTTAFRRMDGQTPSRLLTEPLLAHLRLTQSLAAEADGTAKVQLAAVGSEAASFAGWLAWDMGDHGSARTWYGTAIRAARRASNSLLAAYQLGSLAQFEAHAGNSTQALSLIRSARRHLADQCPAVAEAWLAANEALAHAATGDSDAADRALTAAACIVERIAVEDPPPWPWVLNFTPGKVAATRVTCGAWLGRPRWVLAAQDSISSVMTSGHEKQRALLLADLAMAHMAEGRIDGAFALGARALEIGTRYRSGRIVERVRALRRTYSSPTPPKIVREFDDRLHDVYL